MLKPSLEKVVFHVKQLVFYNDKAGDGQAAHTAELVHAHLRQQGLDYEDINTDTPQAALKLLKAKLATAERLICIGGDGSLNLAVTALLQTKTTPQLAIIPNGTINNFAKSLGIPLDVKRAIANISTGSVQNVGIGSCNDQAVVSSLVFGILADISNNVRQDEKRRFGPIIYVFKGLKGLFTGHSYPIQFKSPQHNAAYKVWSCLITTTNYVGGRQYLQANVPGFAVAILHNFAVLKIPAYVYYLFSGKFSRLKGTTAFATEKLTLSALNQQAVEVRIDGDAGPKLPVQLQWHPAFLRVITPRP
jgi:YegS/Rv2252/BmrU family lipid kinase